MTPEPTPEPDVEPETEPPREPDPDNATDTATTTLTPDVVHPPAKVEDAATSAIERAAEAAIAMPGMPGRDEFLMLAAQARILSLSGASPKLVRESPHLAFHVAMVGRDLGISPSAAIELIDVIPGRDGPRLSLSPQLLNGQIRRLGLGSIIPVVQTADRCVAAAIGPRGLDPACGWPVKHDEHAEGCLCDVLGTTEFTWNDARIADLAGPLCEPGVHKNPPGETRCGCNQGYITYPKRMLWWRGSGFCADDWFPEASLGLYSPEALGSFVDENGRAIDPETVDLPDGYAPKALARPPSAIAADPKVIADLVTRTTAIKEHPNEAAADALREFWKAKELPPVGRLSASATVLAEAGIKAIETRIEKGEFGPAAEPTAATDGAAPEGHETGHVEPGEAPAAGDGEPEPDPPTATQEPDEEQALIDTIAAEVQDLDLAVVIEELGQRGESVRGNEQAKRLRLAQARYLEATTPAPDPAPEVETAPGPAPTLLDGAE